MQAITENIVTWCSGTRLDTDEVVVILMKPASGTNRPGFYKDGPTLRIQEASSSPFPILSKPRPNCQLSTSTTPIMWSPRLFALTILCSSAAAQTPDGFNPSASAQLRVVYGSKAVDPPGTSFTKAGE